MPSKEQMTQAVEAYCRAQTAKDRTAWLALFAEDAVHEDPVGTVRNEGLAKIAAFWDSFQGNDLELWLTEPTIVCGDEAIAFMKCRTGRGESRRESGRIVDQMVFDHAGKIKAVRAFYDHTTW
jgi:ketosteroid isomerase-like protein